MTQQINTIETVKKDIRSLLVSSPRELTVLDLIRDYRQLVGHDIPYRRMGYNTIEDFIYAVPDVVTYRVVQGRLFLSAVLDKKSQKIARLVSLQKKHPPKNSRLPSHCRPQFFTPSTFSQSCRSSSRVKSTPDEAPETSFSTQATSPPKKTPDTSSSAYKIFRGQLKDLILAHPDGIGLWRFEEEFASRTGDWLPVSKLGFNNARELLESVPDIVSVEQRPKIKEPIIIGKIGNRSIANNTGMTCLYIVYVCSCIFDPRC